MFGTSGVRGRVGDEVTAALALDIGRALVTDGAQTVVLGRDARKSGQTLSRAVSAGITECGGNVIDVGVQPTPTVARTVVREEADAGVVVTASHNPAPDNGMKLWAADGRAFGEDANARITELVENLFRNATEHGGEDVSITVGELDDGFYVEDTGLGIPEDKQQAVFEAGYSTAKDGTGFGLTIVTQVAQAHGWSIRVADGPKDGARFEITNVEFIAE